MQSNAGPTFAVVAGTRKCTLEVTSPLRYLIRLAISMMSPTTALPVGSAPAPRP